jgi:hypothetical protein
LLLLLLPCSEPLWVLLLAPVSPLLLSYLLLLLLPYALLLLLLLPAAAGKPMGLLLGM